MAIRTNLVNLLAWLIKKLIKDQAPVQYCPVCQEIIYSDDLQNELDYVFMLIDDDRFDGAKERLNMLERMYGSTPEIIRAGSLIFFMRSDQEEEEEYLTSIKQFTL